MLFFRKLLQNKVFMEILYFMKDTFQSYKNYSVTASFLKKKLHTNRVQRRTGDEGIEPPLKVLETLVIPFDQSPKNNSDIISFSSLNVKYKIIRLL